MLIRVKTYRFRVISAGFFFLFLLINSLNLRAQLKPPGLRCIEILNNGDVKLSWLPAPDPGNFYAYEVYQSSQKNGPYNKLPSNLSALTSSNFVHVGAADTIQSYYYFMTTRSGSGGVNESVHSDTLRSVFLTSFSNNTFGTLDLVYNAIHQPKLKTTAATYTVFKEYPLGTWNVLATTTNTLYHDTITICLAKMNYRVRIADSLGCHSVSSMLRGEYANSKDPEQPYIDSISVLPNGNTVISWKTPLDKDINQYEIQYRTAAGINDSIDTVYGRDANTYTYTTTTANTGTVGIFVKAVDSCGRGSSVYYDISTMHLKTTYNQCAYQTSLRWNSYKWAKIKGIAPESTLEYRIYYSVNGSNFVQVGSTTDTFYVHQKVNPGKNVCYFVRVINTNKTITSSSNRVCFFSTEVEAPDKVYIKSVSIVDNSTARISIVMDTVKISSGVTLQRSENDSTYKTLDFIPYTGKQVYSYDDKTIDALQKTYTYRTIVIDSCGNNRNGSNVCKTMRLKVLTETDVLFTKILQWNAYEGYAGGVSGYAVYRIVQDNGSTSLLGYTDGSTTTYTDNIEFASAEGSDIYYLVEAYEGLGNPYGFQETSFSNKTPVYMEGNLYIPNAFAPSGINNVWKPICFFVDKSEYRVTVFNRWGTKVFEATDQESAWNGAGCSSDVYVYLIQYKNARGEYRQEKGTISLIR